MSFISIDEVVQGSGVGLSSSSSRASQGTTTGLYTIGAPTLAPTPSCSLKLSSACRKGARRGTKCTLVATLSGSALSTDTTVALEVSKTAAGAFKNVKNGAKLTKPNKVLTITATGRAAFYRAQFRAPLCTTVPVRLGGQP